MLMPSPLLGSAIWTPLVPALEHRGRTVGSITGFPPTVSDPDDVLNCYLDSVPCEPDVVLVAHSNAGLYLPLVAAACRAAALVFVDAGLPSGDDSMAVAPPELLDFLHQKADETGVLPPWTQWWEPADRAELFTDPKLQEQVEREQLRLPVSYFAARIRIPTGWDRVPAAYLSFGDTYARQRADAESRGWPVRSLSGHHLHMTVDPEGVAAAIDGLLDEVGVTTGPAG